MRRGAHLRHNTLLAGRRDGYLEIIRSLRKLNADLDALFVSLYGPTTPQEELVATIFWKLPTQEGQDHGEA